jgi:hypothetical protein
MQNGGGVVVGGPIASWLSVLSSVSLYIVATRPRLRGSTKNPVSAMPSGPRIRSVMTSCSVAPSMRSSSTPSTSVALL